MRYSAIAVAALASLADAASPTATDVADVYAAQATALTKSHTSHVKGKVFDRYVSIWLENQDYDIAAADPNLAWFAKKGITLSNNFAVTHPSEPNYMAVVGGEYFGLDGDPFTALPSNISSVVDLLEDKGISWAHYQEDMPYTGFQGMGWVNQKNGANDYVRKHNPEVLYDSVVNKKDRLANIKNTTLFYEDLENNKLPQWLFITPNMTSDGHDTSVTVAGAWVRKFLEPLLADERFMKNTLVMITFDENETYSLANRVFSILIGDSIPSELVGTVDSNYYNHYSELSTVEANWGLHTLGRWDVGANVFAHVGKHTGDTIRNWSATPALGERYFNSSYPGVYNSKKTAPFPVPNAKLEQNGRKVLEKIRKTWQGLANQTYYKNQIETPDGLNPPVRPS